MTTQQFDSVKYKEGQRQEWDSVADAWKKWWPFFERNMQQVNTRLCDMAGIKPGDHVLDISTGIGACCDSCGANRTIGERLCH